MKVGKFLPVLLMNIDEKKMFWIITNRIIEFVWKNG